jgi:hypothetical protein
VTSPFRDEVETLRRENERLRALLSQVRRSRPVFALALAGADIAGAIALRPWLNDGSDARFWAALGLLGAVTVAAAWAALGYRQRLD